MSETSRRAPNGSEIPIFIEKGDIWFSQRAIASLFSTSTQNVSMHISDISARMDMDQLKRELTVAQTEGTRVVERSVIHFAFEIVHMIAIRGQSWAEMEWLIGLTEEFDTQKSYYRIVPKQERDFGVLLQGILKGITPIEAQYRVGRRFIDFFLPAYEIAVEYDEKHHGKQVNKLSDSQREDEIRSHMPNVVFLRVPEGEEVQGLNRLLALLVRRIEQGSGPDR